MLDLHYEMYLLKNIKESIDIVKMRINSLQSESIKKSVAEIKADELSCIIDYMIKEVENE